MEFEISVQKVNLSKTKVYLRCAPRQRHCDKLYYVFFDKITLGGYWLFHKLSKIFFINYPITLAPLPPNRETHLPKLREYTSPAKQFGIIGPVIDCRVMFNPFPRGKADAPLPCLFFKIIISSLNSNNDYLKGRTKNVINGFIIKILSSSKYLQ